MSTIQPAYDKQQQPLDPGGWLIASWSNLANGDVGEAVEFVQFSDRSVQVFGTFGAGGTCLIEGSNDGINFATLTDATDAPLSIATPGIKTIMDVPRKIRPRISAGDGATNLSITILFRRHV